MTGKFGPKTKPKKTSLVISCHSPLLLDSRTSKILFHVFRDIVVIRLHGGENPSIAVLVMRVLIRLSILIMDNNKNRETQKLKIRIYLIRTSAAATQISTSPRAKPQIRNMYAKGRSRDMSAFTIFFASLKGWVTYHWYFF